MLVSALYDVVFLRRFVAFPKVLFLFSPTLTQLAFLIFFSSLFSIKKREKLRLFFLIVEYCQ